MRFAYPIQNGSFISDDALIGAHHDGRDSIDLAVSEGTPLHAITTATVYLTRTDRNENTYGIDDSDTGNCVVLEFNFEGKTLYATYMHMKSVSVKTGDKVVEGQVIGYSGNTGSSNGAHLHLQIREKDPFDPNGGEQVYRTWGENEETRNGAKKNVNYGVTQKLFRFLKVKQATISTTPHKNNGLEPKTIVDGYYSIDLSEEIFGDTSEKKEKNLSTICQLCRDELGDIGNKETQLMNFGLYAKLIRTIYFRHRSEGNYEILPILQKYGGFSGWASRGYPELKNYYYPEEIKQYVKMNILSKDVCFLTGKFYEIANCYPLQNYGYSGAGYGGSRDIENKLEQQILNLNLESHITINSGQTCLIGCIANTGYFTTIDVVENLGDFKENELLINQVKY